MDSQMAAQSLKEENKAVADYNDRLKKTKSEGLKKVFTHAIGEEKEHAKLFRQYSDGDIKEAKKQRGSE